MPTERLARAALQEGGGFQARFLAAEAAHLQGRSRDAERELAALSADAASDTQQAQVALARFENSYSLRGRADLRLIDAVSPITDPSWRLELVARRYSAISMTSGPRIAFKAWRPSAQCRGSAPLGVARAALAHSLVRFGRLGEALELAGPALPDAATPQPDAPWDLSWFSARAAALIYAGRLGEAEKFLTITEDRLRDQAAEGRVFTGDARVHGHIADSVGAANAERQRLRRSAAIWCEQERNTVKPSAQPTLVRTQHLPPPAKTAR